MKRQIFSYWQQGFENAPDVVRMCISSLKRHHEHWDLNLLDSQSAEELIDPIPVPQEKLESLPIAHRSDLVRTQLLLKYGGVWTDPTVYYPRPLDTWIEDSLGEGVFLFSRPGRDRIISNWFIAAEPGNPILAEVYRRLCSFWSAHDASSIGANDRGSPGLLIRILQQDVRLSKLWVRSWLVRTTGHIPYMIYHYMFADVVESRAEFRKSWANVPKIPADGPHALQRIRLLGPLTETARRLVDDSDIPLFKLTWKLPSSGIPSDSILAELFRREQDGCHISKRAGKDKP